LILALCLTALAADFDIKIESEFKKLLPDGAKVEKLAGDFRFLEGPTWLDWDGGFLLFSDIPANHIKKWTAKDGITVFRADSHAANGNIPDNAGNLVTCEHTGRGLSTTDKQGNYRMLVEKSADGNRFSSPNDVAVKSDGTVWFTDPPYGLPKDQKKEQPGNYVFRFDPKTKQAVAVITDFDMPNGICFSPDEKKLYVADSGKPHHIRVFDVNADGAVSNGKIFCTIDKGGPDGIRCDAAGRIWSSAGDGVHIFAPDGALIGKILVPESPANLCFGGPDGKTLFITARTSLYAIKVNAAGTPK
jgi:gluconolactonase